MVFWNGSCKATLRRMGFRIYGQALVSFKWIAAREVVAFTTTEELSIPLLTISSVREYTQDPLGMVFAIRYKAEKSQRRAALFRAASSESRSAWVSNLCEAIREARSEVSGR